jgi:hypothetical protein
MWRTLLFFWAIVLVPFSARCAAAQEPQPTSTPAAEASQDAVEVTLPSADAEATDVGSEDGEVAPLGEWIPVQPTPTPLATVPTGNALSESSHALETPHEGEDEDEETEEIEVESVDTEAELPEDSANRAALQGALHARRIQLSRFQQKRMKHAAAMRRRVVREQAAEWKLNRPVDADPRGAPEIRLCTLDMAYYGGLKDYRRILKAEKLPLREKTERSALRALTKAQCDIVALQSILGTDDKNIDSAMRIFTKKLKKASGAEYDVLLSPANREIVRSGFLVKKGAGDVVRTQYFRNLSFTQFGIFTAKEFTRMPFELVLKVHGKDGAADKELLLLTFDFRNTFVMAEKEREKLRLQMADALRKIVHTELKNFPDDVQPIVVLLGDRRAPKYAPSVQLLEGRLRLVDFAQSGKCTLTEDQKASCASPPKHFKEFFGLSSEGLSAEPVRRQQEIDGVKKQVLVYPDPKVLRRQTLKIWNYTTDIYLRSQDLDLASSSIYRQGRYAAGTIPVQSGLAQSPLVWAELNW